MEETKGSKGSERGERSAGRAGQVSLLVLAGAWLASLVVLAAAGRPVEEPISLLVVFGAALPGVALLLCRGMPPIRPSRAITGEPTLIVGLGLFITIFLAVKGPILAALLGASPDPRVHDVVNTLIKLAAFVVVPLAAYALRGKSPRRLGLTRPGSGTVSRSLVAFGIIGTLFLAIQLLFGRGARPLLDGSLAHRHWVLGLVLCFFWMSVEAGIVEEVFFRVILQSRLAAVTRSQAAGVFLSALVFGLAHAPGLWLRGAGAIEGLGASPSPLVSIAYSITAMGLAGIVFGVLWARTGNWLLIVALHGLGDALPNAPAFIATWRL